MDEVTTLYHVVELEEEAQDAFVNWTMVLTEANTKPTLLNFSNSDGFAWADGEGDFVPSLNMPYTVFEILVALIAIIGNAMVIYVFRVERKLRRRTNYYIVSLAIADLFVGLFGIPFAILAAVGLPTNLHACLFTISLLVVLCTISIFCLVAVSIDRYWAILHPMAYSRNVRTRTAIVIIAACWAAGILIGLLPLFGWHAPQNGNTMCFFVKVMSYDYLVFLYCVTIVTPAILLIAFYAHIYRVIVRQLRQIVTMNPTGSNSNTLNTTVTSPATPNSSSNLQRSNSTSTNIVTGLVQQISRRSSASTKKSVTPTNTSASPQPHPSPFCFRGSPAPQQQQQSGTMLRVLGAAQKREVKATQNLSIIVLFFMICWLPLYTVNCIKAFCQDCEIDSALMLALIALSHVNSAVNPLLYAYHLRDFRAALKNLILRMMGRPVPRTEVHRRISAVSRMQSMREKRQCHPRIYIDSPVWLRQQQVQLKSEVILTGSLSSALRSVVRVASTPTDAGQAEMMSQIQEVPSHAERESSKNLSEMNNNNSSSFGRMVDKARGGGSQQQSSFDCYASDDEDEDEGIRITVRHEANFSRTRIRESRGRRSRKGKEGASESSSDDVFASSSPEEVATNCDPAQDIMMNHSTELPTFHHLNNNHRSLINNNNKNNNVSGRDDCKFYEAFKRRRKGDGSGESPDRCASANRVGEKETEEEDDHRRKKSPRKKKSSDPKHQLISDECNISQYSSSAGTISSEDLTEFRDRSASSVFIIENESVQLSPRHLKLDDERFFSSPTRIRKREPHQHHKRRHSGRDILSKPSPLKVVTKLIFTSSRDGSPSLGGASGAPAGVSGKFNYVDMEDSSIRSPEKKKNVFSSS